MLEIIHFYENDRVTIERADLFGICSFLIKEESWQDC